MQFTENSQIMYQNLSSFFLIGNLILQSTYDVQLLKSFVFNEYPLYESSFQFLTKMLYGVMGYKQT